MKGFVMSEVAIVSCSDEIGLKIIEALGLPRYVTRLELVFEGRKPMRVRCEYMVHEANAIPDGTILELAEYELRKIEPAATPPEA